MPEPSKPAEVAPGLWIAGITGLDFLDSLHITHVVSVVNGQPPDSPELQSLRTLHVDIEDVDDVNLLTHLPAATDFIEEGLTSGGNVLVHCAQGVSRSAALIIAHLVRSHGVDPDTALATIHRRCPSAAPNDGFMLQLHLWHCMEGTLNHSYVPYKRFLAEQAAAEFYATGSVDVAGLSQPLASDGDAQGAAVYRCRKCRTLVATSSNVIETGDGPGATGFRWHKRDKLQKVGDIAASAEGAGGVFVEPLRWMESAVGGSEGIQGKIYCPKCEARLGTFNWAGMQNSEGAWVTPAFQLHSAKLDIEHPSAVAAQQQAGLGIRQPRMMTSSSVVSSTSAAAAQHSPSVPTGETATLQHNPIIGQQKSFFTHLILDCDGVMVDSERPSCEALRRAILQITGFDIPHTFPIDFRPVFGMDVRSCVEYYRARFQKTDWVEDDETLAAKVSSAKEGIYKELTSGGVVAFPGVKKLVDAARERGMGVAVASSGSPEKISHNLTTSGLDGLVPDDLVVSAKYVARGKPAPDVYIEALRRLGCEDASRAVVVEDAINGLAAARAAGCFTVAVATSLPKEALQGHADIIVETIADVDLDALKAL